MIWESPVQSTSAQGILRIFNCAEKTHWRRDEIEWEFVVAKGEKTSSQTTQFRKYQFRKQCIFKNRKF